MILRPHLRLLRTRLIVAAVVVFAMALLKFLATSAEDLNLRALWDRACTCPLEPSDTRILLDMSLLFAFLATILGWGAVVGFNGRTTPGLVSPGRFLLTRPQSRLNVLLTPLLISVASIAIFPGLAWLLLLGWLHMVHAPALEHLIGLLELIPAASQLGPHPSFLSLAATAHLGRFYLAGISLGVCFYTIFSSSNWLSQSRFTWIKILGFLSYLSILAGGWRFIPRSFLFILPKDGTLTYIPSATAIALHFAFALVWLCGTLWVVRDLEL